MPGEVSVFSDSLQEGRGGEGGEGWCRTRMVVPLCSHMTNLCLLQGVQATCQSGLSLSLPLFLHPSHLSPTSKPMHVSVCSGSPHAFVAVVFRFQMQWLLFLKWRLLSLTMSLLCCFFFRDYGSKRKSGKSPMVHSFHTCSLFYLVADQN